MQLSRNAARRAARRAFTLMEVLVVVAIIVVLASIATVSFKYLTDTKYDAAKAKMKSIETAITSFRTHNGRLPQSVAELTTADEKGEALLDDDAALDPWGQPFEITGEVTKAGRPRIMSHGEPGRSKPVYNW